MRFSDKEVEAIRLAFASGENKFAIAARLRCPFNVIDRIVTGVDYPDIAGPTFPHKPRSNSKAFAVALEKRRIIASLWCMGVHSLAELADAARCTIKEARAVVSAIRRRERELD